MLAGAIAFCSTSMMLTSCTEAEDNHIGCWLALESEESETAALALGIGKEAARDFIDKHIIPSLLFISTK